MRLKTWDDKFSKKRPKSIISISTCFFEQQQSKPLKQGNALKSGHTTP